MSNKIIDNFLIPLFLFISILYAFHSFGHNNGGSHTIILNKVYHHTAPDEGYLEKANIALYFSGDPGVQRVVPTSRQAQTSLTYFFPHATINYDECQSMISALNNHNANYRVAISSNNQKQGVDIQFDIDPQKYLISCEQFDSIGLQKGFVFRIYNKELLTKLEKAQDQPVLRILHNVNKPPRIVIDPGHGGRDTGAIGHYGIQEKNVTLAIGTEVGNLLEKNGCSVVLTRRSDSDLPLDQRTSYANNHSADLFVSIHANYAHNAKAIGVETFCMQQQLLHKKYSQLSDEQDMYVTHIMKQRAGCAYDMAQAVQRAVCSYVSPFHTQSIDRKVKHSISQVLLGVQFPAILIEVGFLSHPQESQLLNDAQYQHGIARGICDGILSRVHF